MVVLKSPLHATLDTTSVG